MILVRRWVAGVSATVSAADMGTLRFCENKGFLDMGLGVQSRTGEADGRCLISRDALGSTKETLEMGKERWEQRRQRKQKTEIKRWSGLFDFFFFLSLVCSGRWVEVELKRFWAKRA